MNNPQKCAIHRSYVIELEQNADGNWIVPAITHSFNGSRLLPPAFGHPDGATAERIARAAVDFQLSGRKYGERSTRGSN